MGSLLLFFLDIPSYRVGVSLLDCELGTSISSLEIF